MTKDYIDTHSEHSLYDVLNNTIPAGESTEYMSFHIVSQGTGTYHAQLDGHAGQVESFTHEDYDDVLELVGDLNNLVTRRWEYDYQDDKQALVEWAGEIMTRDEEKAKDSDIYIHIPDPPAEPAV